MGPFEMVVAIVVVGCIAEMYRNRLKYMQGRSDFDKDDWLGIMGESESKHKKKIAELEERIKVLERIVTDQKYDLKKEFDKLDAA